jgi:hypothetical protein
MTFLYVTEFTMRGSDSYTVNEGITKDPETKPPPPPPPKKKKREKSKITGIIINKHDKMILSWYCLSSTNSFLFISSSKDVDT